MTNAALTFVFNEAVNLPVWLKYYGSLFGPENLFVIDRSSTDGSTDNLGKVNVIRIARDAFDEDAKTNLMSSFHSGLTSLYDAVIVTDCDEIVAPDPQYYTDLNDYIEKLNHDYVNAIGIDIVHIITEELPLDPNLPILSQRSTGRFHAPECKHLLSRVPIDWLPGLHSSNKPPNFDENLFIFHLKLMDFQSAVQRQTINLSTGWSEQSLAHNYGSHHRWSMKQFVTQGFFSPIDLLNRGEVHDFTFGDEVGKLVQGTMIDSNGYYRVPMNLSKMVRIPDRFRAVV